MKFARQKCERWFRNFPRTTVVLGCRPPPPLRLPLREARGVQWDPSEFKMNFIAPGTHRTERALQKEKTLPEGTTRGPRTVAGRVRTLLLLAACASMLGDCAVGSGEVRDLSTEKAARLIIDGRTTMAQIDAELGEPDYEIHMGHEIVRHYSWMRGRPSAKNFIPFNPISEFPITQKNLRIWFDKTGVVKRHEFTGVFYIYRAPLVGTDAPHSFRPLTPAELDHFSE